MISSCIFEGSEKFIYPPGCPWPYPGKVALIITQREIQNKWKFSLLTQNNQKLCIQIGKTGICITMIGTLDGWNVKKSKMKDLSSHKTWSHTWTSEHLLGQFLYSLSCQWSCRTLDWVCLAPEKSNPPPEQCIWRMKGTEQWYSQLQSLTCLRDGLIHSTLSRLNFLKIKSRERRWKGQGEWRVAGGTHWLAQLPESLLLSQG